MTESPSPQLMFPKKHPTPLGRTRGRTSVWLRAWSRPAAGQALFAILKPGWKPDLQQKNKQAESKRWVWRCVKPVSSFFHPFPSTHIGILECCPSSSSFPPVLRKPMTDLGAAAPPMGERVPQGVVFEATWHRSARCMVWRDTDDHSRTAVVWQFWDVWKMAYTWVIYLILFVLLSHQDKCGYPLVIQHGHGASPYLRFEYKTSYKWVISMVIFNRQKVNQPYQPYQPFCTGHLRLRISKNMTCGAQSRWTNSWRSKMPRAKRLITWRRPRRAKSWTPRPRCDVPRFLFKGNGRQSRVSSWISYVISELYILNGKWHDGLWSSQIYLCSGPLSEHSAETNCGCWEAQKYQKPTHVKDSAYTPPSRPSGNEKEKDEKANVFFPFFPSQIIGIIGLVNEKKVPKPQYFTRTTWFPAGFSVN